MAASHLSNDEFFTSLTSLISTTQQKGHGSVYLTQKRLTYGSEIENDLPPPTNPLPLIVRATDGKSNSKEKGKDGKREKNKNKVRLSTIVQPDDLEAFFTRYAEVCKGGMQSLKKRDRSKRKKVKKVKKEA